MVNKRFAPYISVIVPIYNVEGFLLKCLNSIANQTFKNLEVILVNDGSRDSSRKIAQEFCLSHKNFFLINEENNGQSAARNRGLSEARGKYISFVDSDDYLHPQFLEKLYALSVIHNADISCCNFFFYFPKAKIKVLCPFRGKNSIYFSSEALKKLISGTTLQGFVWNKLYRRSLFVDNNIKFQNICFEDLAIVPQLFYHSDKIAITSRPLYYYTQRKGSAMRSINADEIEDYIKSFGFIRNFLEHEKKYEAYKKSINSYTKKMKLMTNLYIFNLHLRTFNFKNLTKNIKNSSKSIKFFLEEDYQPTTGIPDIPFPLLEPKDKKQEEKRA
ncbi:MAG: glycosyltransferase [Oscillospiraceae bacterium]|jgi:glycosyltransferase involved in cell wall biosynthesis|nr:glycosyltransferase [Oscillospiraceae bacterium]